MNQNNKKEEKQISQADKIQKVIWQRKWQEVIIGGAIVFAVFSLFAVVNLIMKPTPKIEDYFPYKEIVGRETMTDAEKTGKILFFGGCGVVALIGACVIAFGSFKFYNFPGVEKLEEKRKRKEQARAEREQKIKERAEKANQARLEKEKVKAAKKLAKEMAKPEEKSEPEKPKPEEHKEEKKPKWSLKNLLGLFRGKKKVEAVATETIAPEKAIKPPSEVEVQEQQKQQPVKTEEEHAEVAGEPKAKKVAAPSDSFFDREFGKASEENKKTGSQEPQPQPEKPKDDEPLELKPLDEGQ